MRVLHVYRTYFPDTQGGLEEAIRQICVNTSVNGVQNRVFTLTKTSDDCCINNSEAKVYRAKQLFEVASCGVSIDAFAKFNELAKWADILHFHYPWPFEDLLYLFSANKKPSVVTYHSDIVRQRLLGFFYKPLMRMFLGRVARIVATSENYLNSSPILKQYKSKTLMIPLALNRDTYPKVEECKSELGENYGDYFFFVGVLRYYKGVHILLEAAKDAPYNIVIAGSGPLELDLKNKARSLKLTNVFFVGQVSDNEKVLFIKNSLGIVFPSIARSEAFGVTLLEGLMYGKALISTELGTGTSYVNKDKETGLVVPANNSDALRRAMDSLISDSVIREEMENNAKLRFESLFTGEEMGKKYIALYESLLTV